MDQLNTLLFFLTLLPSAAIGYWIFKDGTTLISKRIYLYSIGTFLIMVPLFIGAAFIATWLMSLTMGIGMGIWGTLVYLSFKIRKEERENLYGNTKT